MRATDVALALLIVLVWGVNFIAIRLGLNGLPTLLLVALRFLMSAVPAIFILRRPDVPLRYLAGYALLVGMGQYSLLYGALKLGMPAGLSSILMQMQSFFTLGAAALALRERILPVQVLGVAIAAIGLILIGLNLDRAVGLLPLLMVIGAALSWGVGNVVTRSATNWARANNKSIDMLAFTVWGSVLPIVPMFALSAAVEGVDAWQRATTSAGWVALAAMLYTAYLSTVFGFGAWNKLIGKYGASQIAPFSLLVPFVGMVGTAIALGEVVTSVSIYAGALVMIGLWVNVFGYRALSLLGNAGRACD